MADTLQQPLAIRDAVGLVVDHQDCPSHRVRPPGRDSNHGARIPWLKDRAPSQVGLRAPGPARSQPRRGMATFPRGARLPHRARDAPPSTTTCASNPRFRGRSRLAPPLLPTYDRRLVASSSPTRAAMAATPSASPGRHRSGPPQRGRTLLGSDAGAVAARSIRPGAGPTHAEPGHKRVRGERPRRLPVLAPLTYPYCSPVLARTLATQAARPGGAAWTVASSRPSVAARRSGGRQARRGAPEPGASHRRLRPALGLRDARAN